jgi:hypothetical protein
MIGILSRVAMGIAVADSFTDRARQTNVQPKKQRKHMQYENTTELKRRKKQEQLAYHVGCQETGCNLTPCLESIFAALSFCHTADRRQ